MNNIVGICGQLKDLGEEMNNQLFLQTILEKLNKKVNKKYVDKYIEDDCIWSWDHVRISIEKIIAKMEKVEENMNQGSKTSEDIKHDKLTPGGKEDKGYSVERTTISQNTVEQ